MICDLAVYANKERHYLLQNANFNTRNTNTVDCSPSVCIFLVSNR